MTLPIEKYSQCESCKKWRLHKRDGSGRWKCPCGHSGAKVPKHRESRRTVQKSPMRTTLAAAYQLWIADCWARQDLSGLKRIASILIPHRGAA